MYCKDKDRNPIETISLIRNYLDKMDILVTEQWKVDYTELFSVNLFIRGTNFYANGKGTSSEYALASGYAELIERMHNLALFRFSSTIFDEDDEDFDKNVFLGSYDDYHRAFSQIVSCIPDDRACEINANDMIAYSKAKHKNNRVKIMKYKSIMDNEEICVPVNILDYLYGSNGMVAGNTQQEAYVQGLSEVLERHVTKEIYSSGHVPPTLDDSLLSQLENYNDIKFYISQIEKTQRYKVELKDMSLGKNIPAIGLVLYDTSNASYFVKVGAHPNISIAIERCFTELMQGQLIDSMRALTDISETVVKLRDIGDEPGQVLPVDIAPFPINMFVVGNTHPLISIRRFNNNFEMMDFLIDLIYDLGYKIFVRDATQSDIKVYHFIVPGMSELNNYKYDRLNKGHIWFEISSMIKDNIATLNEEQARILLENIKAVSFDEMQSMSLLLRNMPFSEKSIYRNTPIIVFKFRLYLIIKDYKNAYDCLSRYNSHLKKDNKKSMFFDCYATLLSFLISGKDMETIFNLLNKFYKLSIVENVINDFKDYPFINFPNLYCDNFCDKCTLQNECFKKNELAIYQKMKNMRSMSHS